jgi:hypothetical protein
MSSSPRYNSYLRQIYKGSKKYDDYLSEIEPGEEGDGPGVLGTAADVGEQLLATSADFVLRSGKGVANIIGGLARGAGTVNPALKASIGTEQIADVADRTANRLQQQREDVFRYAPPDTKAGVGAAVLGGLGTEGVAYVATGGPVGKALGRAFGATTKAATKEAAKLPARMAGGLKEAGRDALAVAPLDATAAAVGPENSLAGVIGEYTGNELALDIAENPLLRGISESALGGFGDVLVRGAVGLRRLRNAKPLPKPEPRIPMPEVPEPAPRPEPVLRPPVADELTAQLERSREAAARAGREVADKAAADRAAAASQRRVAANTAQREAEQARAAERARLPKPDEISTTVEKPSSKPLALTPEIQYSVASSNAKDFSLPEPEVPQPRRNTTTMDRRTGERSLLGDLKALQRALPTAEADPEVRVLQLRAPGETDDVLSSLSNAASEVGAPSRAFHIGGEDYVMLAPADKADALLSRTREAGFSGSIGNTLREADEAMRAADLSAAQSRVKANGNGNGKVPAVEVPKVEVTEDVAPAAVATPAPVREPLTPEQQRILHGTKRVGDTALDRAAPEPQAAVAADPFTADMTPMQRARAEKALAQQMSHNGTVRTRREIVDAMIADGATVVTHPKDGRRLMRPDGSYIEEARLTKTAMDYAEYVSRAPVRETTPPTPETSAPRTEAAPAQSLRVSEMPVAEIDVEPDRFQFKIDTNSKGVGRELESVKKYDPNLAGVIQVWRDPADGRVKVVNGHHRLDLAKRLGVENVAVRFIDAADAAEARTIGAMTNIAEGRGTPVDAAKLFREQGITPDDLETRGISLRGAVARDGLALSKLPDGLFRQVVTGELPLQRAVTLGASGLDEAQQTALHQLLRAREAKGRVLKNDELAELVRFVKGAGEENTVQETLFGAESFAKSLAPEKAELSAVVRDRLSRDKRLFGYLSKGKRAERVAEEGAGKIEVDKAREIADAATRAEEVYIRLSGMRGPVSDALNDAAAKLAKGGDKNAIQQELYERVREAVSAELDALTGGRKGAATEVVPPRTGGGSGPEGAVRTDEPAAPSPAELDLFDSRRAGGAAPEVVGALARVGGGAVAGSVAGAAVAPEGMDKEFAVGGALAGAGLGTAAARRALKKAPAPTLKYSTDPDVLAVAASVGVKPKAKPPLSAGNDILDTVGRWLHYKASRDVLPMEHYGEVVGKSKALRNTLAQVRGQSAAAYQHLEDALTPVLRLRDKAPLDVHALARAERGLELAKLHDKLATPEQIRQWEKTVAELGSVPEVREAVDALRKYFRNLLEMKRDVGLITAEKFDEITKNADAYIPTIPDDVVASLKRGVGGNRYAPNRTAGVRKMGKELNEKNIVDPFEQAIYDTMETFARVGKQRIANVIVGMAEANPQEALAFLREVKPSRGPGGMIIPPKPEKEGATIIDAIINGKRKFYEVTDKDLADSWATFTPPVQSVAMKVLSASKQLVQEGVTGNPIFPLANGIKDFFMSGVQYPIFTGGFGKQIGKAGLTLGGGAAVGAATNEDNRAMGAAAGAGIAGTLIGVRHTGKHIARTLSAMNDILGPQVMGSVLGGIGGAFAGKEQDHPFIGFLAGLTVGTAGGRAARNLLAGNPEVYKEFIREGGGGFGFYAKTTKDAKRIEAQLLKEGVSASDFVSPRSWWDAIQYVSRAVETAPRLAFYKELKKAGVETGEAIFRSRDLSLDYSVRPGSKFLRKVTETVPFANPMIQGTDKLVRLLTNPRTTATAAATIIAPTIALWALNHSSPEMAKAYDGRPSYEKNNYWLVPKVVTGGQVGEFWRVPKPFEVGFIYASLPERVLDYTQQSDPELLAFSLGDMYGQFAEGFTGMPAIIAPQLDIRKGEHGFDPFRRREIDPFPQKELPAEFQYDDRTSTAAIALGKVLPGEQSPAKIDYALRGYTGTLGGEFLDITSKAARNLGWDDRPEPSTRSTAFLSRFETKPESATEAELSVRRKFATAEKQYNALKQLLADGQPEKAQKYAERHRETLSQYYDLQEKMTELGEVSKARRAIAKADIPAAKKREMLVGVNAIVSEILSRNASAATK